MFPVLLQVFLLHLVYVSQSEAQASLKFSKFNVACTDNDWMGKWDQAMITPEGKLTSNIPILSTISEATGITVKMNANYCGMQIPEMKENICGALSNKLYGSTVVDCGEPKGVFPDNCDIEPNNEYRMVDFTLGSATLPPCPTPNGKVSGTLSITGPSDETLCDVDFEGSMDLPIAMPGMGK